MDAWKEYVLSVVTVALACSIVLQILPDSGRKELLHIVCGVILTMVILRPVSDLRPEDLGDLLQYENVSAEPYLAAGESTASEVKKQYITNACEAYILNKAKAMGAEIVPAITLDEECLPVSAEIHGTADPQLREALERILMVDMGITKENQRWTGNPGSSG